MQGLRFQFLSLLRLPDRKRFRDLSADEWEDALASGSYAPDVIDIAGNIAPNTYQRASYYFISGTTDRSPEIDLWKGLSGAAVFDNDDCMSVW